MDYVIESSFMELQIGSCTIGITKLCDTHGLWNSCHASVEVVIGYRIYYVCHCVCSQSSVNTTYSQ